MLLRIDSANVPTPKPAAKPVEYKSLITLI